MLGFQSSSNTNLGDESFFGLGDARWFTWHFRGCKWFALMRWATVLRQWHGVWDYSLYSWFPWASAQYQFLQVMPLVHGLFFASKFEVNTRRRTWVQVDSTRAICVWCFSSIFLKFNVSSCFSTMQLSWSKNMATVSHRAWGKRFHVLFCNKQMLSSIVMPLRRTRRKIWTLKHVFSLQKKSMSLYFRYQIIDIVFWFTFHYITLYYISFC